MYHIAVSSLRPSAAERPSSAAGAAERPMTHEKPTCGPGLLQRLVRLISYDVPCSFSYLASERGPGKLKNWISRMRAAAMPAPALINPITSSV